MLGRLLRSLGQTLLVAAILSGLAAISLYRDGKIGSGPGWGRLVQMMQIYGWGAVLAAIVAGLFRGAFSSAIGAIAVSSIAGVAFVMGLVWVTHGPPWAVGPTLLVVQVVAGIMCGIVAGLIGRHFASTR